MKMVKVDTENISWLKNKSIICIDSDSRYIVQFCERYNVVSNIEFVISFSTREVSGMQICGRTIPIKGMEELAGLNWKNRVPVIIGDYFEETYDRLCSISDVRNNVHIIYWFPDKETEYELHYRRVYRNHKLENIILFRSGPHASAYVRGMDFNDNARALFEYMLRNHYNNIYKLIWLVKNPEEFVWYEKIPNVEFISFDWSASENEGERDSYYKVLCLAKYIFFTDAYGFARNCSADQTRVQLWHGCGFKTRVNFVRCEKRYEYTTVISDLYSKIHQEIYGLRSDQMLVTGYAKQDLLFHPIEDFAKRLSLPEAVKYIFWLPTFRTARKELDNLSEYTMENQTGLPILDTFEEIENLNEVLKIRETILLVKLHPFQDKSQIFSAEMSNIIFLDNDVLFDNDIHINELLGWADALISDYSSVAVDYMLLDRPIAFTLDDVDEYKNSRGFVFENIQEWLPGEEIYNYDDFRRYIIEVSEGKDSKREKRKILLDKMHKYHDSNSCRRILEALKIIKDERGDGTNEI